VVSGSHVEVVDKLEDLLEWVLGALLGGLDLVHLAHEEVVEGHGVDLLIECSGDRADLLDLLLLGTDLVEEIAHESGLGGAD